MSALGVETQEARANRSTNKPPAERSLCGGFGRGDGIIFASMGKWKVEVFMRGSMASRPQASARVNRQPRIRRRISKRFGGCGSNPSQQQRPRDDKNAVSGSWSRRRDLRLWRRALVGARRTSRASAFGKHHAFSACSSFSRKSFAAQNLCGSPAISPPGCSVCAHPICFRAIRAQTARSPLAPPPSNPVDVRENGKESRRKSALFSVVEATGFEPTTSWSRTKRATKLRYASNGEYYIKPGTLLQAFLSRCNKNPARRERGKVRKTIRGGPVSRVLSSAVIYLRPPSPTGSSVIHGSARTGSPYEQSPNLHRTGFTWHGALPSRR